jgi:iron complex transport system substrate-binding protein
MKIVSVLLSFVILVFVLVFSPVAAEKISITDDLGREVTIDHPAQAIGFQHYATAEALKIAGVWDKVVARDGYISDNRFFPRLSEIPAINPPSGTLDLNYEKIFAAKPDVFIIQKQDWNREQINGVIQKLEPEIPVVVLDFIDPLATPESFEKLGKVTGSESATEKYAAFVKGITSEIQEKTSGLPDAEKPLVFFKAPSYKPNQIFTYGNGMKYWADMLDIAGGTNVVSNQSAAWFEVDNEWLLKNKIDYIVSHCRESMYPGVFGYNVTNQAGAISGADAIISNITGTEVLAETDAVKNNKVYLVADPLTGTPRSVVGIAYLARRLHPDLFADLDPEEIHQRYLTDFIGADYDLQNLGLFGYPA